jgi:hypothetical protein
VPQRRRYCWALRYATVVLRRFALRRTDGSVGATAALQGQVKNWENPGVTATPGAPTSLRSATPQPDAPGFGAGGGAVGNTQTRGVVLLQRRAPLGTRNGCATRIADCGGILSFGSCWEGSFFRRDYRRCTIGMDGVERAGCIGGCASSAMECFSATSRGATSGC